MMRAYSKTSRRALACMLAVLLGCGMALGGCAPRAVLTPSTLTPEPKLSPMPVASDPDGQYTTETVLLYVPNATLTAVSSVTRTLTLIGSETMYEGVVRAILAEVRNASLQQLSISLLSIGISGSGVTVDISGDLALLDDAQRFALIYCITQSLTRFDGVSHVTLLEDGSAMALEGVPYGALESFEYDMDTAFWRQSRQVGQSAATRATLYFGARTGEHLLSETREIAFTSFAAALETLVGELARGPRDTSDKLRMLPSGAYLAEWKIEGASGGALLCLTIDGSVLTYFDRSGVDIDAAAGAIALTMLECCPTVSYVSVFFDGGQDGRERMSRSELELTLGSNIELFFPLADMSGVAAVERTVASYRLHLTETLLAEMFSAPTGEEYPGAAPMMPDGTATGDIISIEAESGVALVNVTANFIASLRAMEAQAERCCVYGIVNTICTAQGAASVLFLADGASCGNVPGRINLSEPLYYNPGLVQG